MESDQEEGFEKSQSSSGLSGNKRAFKGSSGVRNDGSDGSLDSVIKKGRVAERYPVEGEDQEGKSEEGPIKKGRVAESSPIRGVIVLSSYDDEEGGKLENLRYYEGKGKEVDLGLHLGLGTHERDGNDDDGIPGQRRYTREEKGKRKVDDREEKGSEDLSLSLTSRARLVDEDQVSNCWFPSDSELSAVQSLLSLPTGLERGEEIPRQGRVELMPENGERERIEPLFQASEIVEMLELREIEHEYRLAVFRHSALEHAHRFAHFKQDDEYEWSWYRRQPTAKIEKPSEAKMKLQDSSGPFSSALQNIKEQNEKYDAEKMIEWKPHKSNIRRQLVPSLLDLSLNVLARNAEKISSLDHVPDFLRQRLANLVCDARKMNVRILELLFEGSPTVICVKDCSWITDAQLVKTFGKSDMKNLRVLKLDLCGQCSLDSFIRNSLAQTSNSLPCLGVLSLRGVGSLSDDTLKPLVVSAPLLQSINLGESSLLTFAGIKILADSLKTNLRELYIDECPRIEAMPSLPSLKKFEQLEVLSVAGIQTVCDEFVNGVVAACGGSLMELDLAGCQEITDESLKTIGNHCPKLCSLNISNLHKLTDSGMCYLANGCISLQSLNITRDQFSDEAVAAFLQVSGGSLKGLLLNSVHKVSFNTAFSLAKYSRNLTSLDLSWCRNITNETLGFIVDGCLSLRLLKIFGCSQITDSFLQGHSNPVLHIVGLNLTPLQKHVNMFETVGVFLHYSPLKGS